MMLLEDTEGHIDPLSMLPTKESQRIFKEKMDSVKKAGIEPATVYWQRLLNEKKITSGCFTGLKRFDTDVKNYLSKPSINIEELDAWFENEIIETKKNINLKYEEKDYIIRFQTMVQYLMNAEMKSIFQPSIIKGGRVMESSCISQIASCGYNTISGWASVGAFIGGIIPGVGNVLGGVVGGVAGFFYGLVACSCDGAPCTAPQALSTPDICYNSYAGLDFTLSGFGNVNTSSGGFRLLIYSNSTLTNLLTDKISTYSTIHVSDSELQGNSVIYVMAVTNCDGIYKYANAVEVFNLNTLGHPYFYIDGNTNPSVNSQQFYQMTGRNLNSVNWNIYTYGPTNGTILSQSSYGANVLWNNNAGFVHLVANANSACGSYSDGKYITTHN